MESGEWRVRTVLQPIRRGGRPCPPAAVPTCRGGRSRCGSVTARLGHATGVSFTPAPPLRYPVRPPPFQLVGADDSVRPPIRTAPRDGGRRKKQGRSFDRPKSFFRIRGFNIRQTQKIVHADTVKMCQLYQQFIRQGLGAGFDITILALGDAYASRHFFLFQIMIFPQVPKSGDKIIHAITSTRFFRVLFRISQYSPE